jgi:hypothetical protein
MGDRASVGRPAPTLTECQAACVRVIRKAGRRLTGPKVQEALKHEFGKCTITTALRDLCKPPLNALTRGGKGRGSKGYGLPEWGDGPGPNRAAGAKRTD